MDDRESQTGSIKILVVDDDEPFLRGLERQLDRFGYETRSATDGASGLILAEVERPDVVLLDIRLPVIDGHTFLRRLSALGLDTAVVAMSGQGEMDDVIDAMRAGAVDFLAKPFSQTQLLTAIAHAISRQRRDLSAARGADETEASKISEQPKRPYRVLFVDDEPNVLESLRNRFRKQRDWTMAFADGGEAALAEMRKEPFDVVVSDVQMPGMNGVTLLERVREEFPPTVRMVLTGHAERGLMVRALAVAHQCLAKPCEMDTLRNAIVRACGLREHLNNAVLCRIIGRIDKLPSLPQAYTEINRALAEPNTTAKEIARIVERDPSMSAKILQLVNSSYFGLAQRVTAIEQAVAYLGTEMVRSLALTAHIFAVIDREPPIPGFSWETFQAHALVVATVAAQLPQNQKEAQDAFTAALLHDIGILILAVTLPKTLTEILERCHAERALLQDKETEILGVTHGEIGAYLLGLWGLPDSIVETVALARSPERVSQQGFDVLAAVHVADALVDGLLPPASGIHDSRTLDSAYLASLGIAERMSSWRAIAEKAVLGTVHAG